MADHHRKDCCLDQRNDKSVVTPAPECDRELPHHILLPEEETSAHGYPPHSSAHCHIRSELIHDQPTHRCAATSKHYPPTSGYWRESLDHLSEDNTLPKGCHHNRYTTDRCAPELSLPTRGPLPNPCLHLLKAGTAFQCHRDPR